jgi:hypothetical protein
VIASQPQSSWTPRKVYIFPRGTEGTVAEDRASKLVVFFDTTVSASMDDRNLSPVRG